MKNKARDEYMLDSDRPAGAVNLNNNEQRIEYYRKAWQQGSLKINAPQLAQSIIDFETDVEIALPKTPPDSDSKHCTRLCTFDENN